MEMITIKGYVNVLPPSLDARQARVFILKDDEEYRILSKGAGVDLIDHISEPVEATGQVEKEEDGIYYMTVRSYKILEDDWEG